MKDFFIRCACHSLDHLVVFSYDPLDPDEVYLEVHLVDYNHWWQRLWRAMRYVFGKPCRYGDWDEVLLSPDKATELYYFLDEYLDAWDEWQAREICNPTPIREGRP